MKVTVIQNQVFEDINHTLNSLTQQLSVLDLSNSDFLVLPEMFMTPYEYNFITNYKQTLSSTVINYLSELAKKYHTYIIGGSIPFDDDGSLYNTCFVFDRHGNVIFRYDKMYLFEVTYPSGKFFSERNFFKEGNELGIFDTEFGKMGVMICFDIRFPELAEKLMKKGSRVIFVPAAFNTFTGPMHWQTTFRARAIDNQLFMVGCSPSVESFGKYQYYGHSILVNPLGEIMKELEGTKGVIQYELELDEIDKARDTIPIIKNKRIMIK